MLGVTVYTISTIFVDFQQHQLVDQRTKVIENHHEIFLVEVHTTTGK